MTVRPSPLIIEGAEAINLLKACAAEVAAGRLIPYLGTGVADLSAPSVPTTPEKLAAFLNSKVAVPARVRTNLWGAAQFIDSRKHRKTLVALMSEAFAAPVKPNLVHEWLARLPAPVIVSSWYDGAMAAALQAAGRTDFVEVQGSTRAEVGEARWFRFYDAAGAETTAAAADAATTVLYSPHGSITPARNFLVADSDYVEVLTEIDIQSPIPDVIKERRSARGFFFLGCRFHDQMLRTYARQIAKRSVGRHVVVGDPAGYTRNELKFFAEYGVAVVAMPLESAMEIVTRLA
ncbi:MAG: SIR2 family protein [Hyphomicrobiaceae bacterium]|nr:SIR2 family protein [Hyphomicrobiaceae bacterium]